MLTDVPVSQPSGVLDLSNYDVPLNDNGFIDGENDNTPELTPHEYDAAVKAPTGREVMTRSISDDYEYVQIEEKQMSINDEVVEDEPGQTDEFHGQIENNEVDTNIENETKSDLLPGWVELTDPSTGTPYYYNEEEGISSWEKPIVDSLDVVQENIKKAISVNRIRR